MLSKHQFINQHINQHQRVSVADSNRIVAGNRGRQPKQHDPGAIGDQTRIERAETRTEQAKTRTELAETRTEQAEARTELAKTRTEQAETRAEQAETRAEHAETALQSVVNKGVRVHQEISTGLPRTFPVDGMAGQKSQLEQLTSRQREILQLIAEGQNTKQIAGILKISPKTVEYHRMKLMDCLKVHSIPGLVRFALRVGVILQES